MQSISSLESPTAVDESFEVTSILLFIPDFNLLSSELDNFTFKVLYLSHFILHSLCYIKKITTLLQFPLKTLKRFLLLLL